MDFVSTETNPNNNFTFLKEFIYTLKEDDNLDLILSKSH